MSEKNSQPCSQVAVNKQMGAKSDSMGPSEFTTAASASAPAKVVVTTGTEMGLKPMFDLNKLPVSDKDEEEAPAAEVAVAVEDAGGSASSRKRKIPEGESRFKQQFKRVKDSVGKWEDAGGSASSRKRKIPEGESGFKQQFKRMKDSVGNWLFKEGISWRAGMENAVEVLWALE